MHGGRRVVLVSSGAIACGQHVLGVSERPHQVPALQAASAVGQGRLFAHYERLFGDHELTAAQVLLTSEDFARRASYVNARNTLRRLLAWGVVPVVNENDTTATDEIRFGDNDVLAAQVAIMLRADLLVLLTDQDGLYTMDPRKHGAAELVRRVDATRRSSPRSTSATPRAAAPAACAARPPRRSWPPRPTCARSSPTARGPASLTAAVAGEDVGTQILARATSASAFKLWLRYAKPVRGTLEVDAGAARALAQGGSSLLPVGVKAVHGSFAAGDAVAIVGPRRRRGRPRDRPR